MKEKKTYRQPEVALIETDDLCQLIETSTGEAIVSDGEGGDNVYSRSFYVDETEEW